MNIRKRRGRLYFHIWAPEPLGFRLGFGINALRGAAGQRAKGTGPGINFTLWLGPIIVSLAREGRKTEDHLGWIAYWEKYYERAVDHIDFEDTVHTVHFKSGGHIHVPTWTP